MRACKKRLKILNQNDFKIFKNLIKKFTTRVYFVGGFCRDYFLNKISNDIDIEIYGLDPKEFDQIMLKLGAVGVGKSFFVYKYKNFDISLARIETKISNTHNGFSVEICNDEKLGAIRRDFKMNSIMINIFSLEILDFYGGIDDIKKRQISLIDKQRFKEDSLRVLRGIQFSSRLNFKIDANTLKVMASISLVNLSKDRIKIELEKFFKSTHLEVGFYYIYELKIFKFLFLKEIEHKKFAYLFNFFKYKKSKNEMFFLYVISNVLKINKKELLTHLNFSKKYLSELNQEFFYRFSDEKLMQISLKMPLKNWLGLYTKKRISRAKELKIFENKFSLDYSKISPKDIKKFQKIKIKEYLKHF